MPGIPHRSLGKTLNAHATLEHGIKVKGQWYYLYRAVDKHGQTIDFLLTEHRDKAAALRFLKKAIRWNGAPETMRYTAEFRLQ